MKIMHNNTARGFAGLVATALLLWSVFGLHNKRVENDGQARQERVETAYLAAQTSLSKCLDQGNVVANVIDEEFKVIKDILVDAVSARYQTGDGRGLGDDAFMLFVAEDYPEIDQSSFHNLTDVMVGCRDEYNNAQGRVHYMVGDFESWIAADMPWNSGTKSNFPTDELSALDYSTNTLLTGTAALELMETPIIVDDARTAYAEGEMPEQDLFGNN